MYKYNYWDLAVEEIKTNTSCNKFIISAEGLPGWRLGHIRHIENMFKCVCDIKIIAYLRRQDTFVWSWFSQLVKTTSPDLNLNEFINVLYANKKLLCYESFINDWAECFDSENMIIETYPTRGNLIKDFFQKIGIDTTVPIRKSMIINTSLQPEQIVFFRDFATEWECKITMQQAQTPFDIEFNYTKSLISPQKRQQILDDFDECNSNIARAYLNREKLFDDLTIPDRYTWSYPDIKKNGYYEKAIEHINSITQ